MFNRLAAKAIPVGAVCLIGLLLAACSKAPRAVGQSSLTPTASQLTVTSVSTDSTTASPNGSDGTSGSVSATASASTTGPSRSTAPTGPPACTEASLSVSVERGSGAAGHQFATFVFTNKSLALCSLTGFPGIVLLEAGHQLGAPADRSEKTVVRVSLKPGARASAQLSDASTCNADNSDAVQVIAPNTTGKTVLALRLRGCTLTIDPVTAG